MAYKLEALQRNFLWGSFGSDFKFHLVRWNIVKQSLSIGGLGVRDLRLFNEALLGKWLWIFLNEKGNLWREIVATKYGSTNIGWYPAMPNGAYGCSLWRYISKCWESFSPYFPLRSVMERPYLFGTISGMGMASLKNCSLAFSLLRRTGRLLWWIIGCKELTARFGCLFLCGMVSLMMML